MGNFAAARLSPEIVGGELRWYYGDTFQLNLHLRLEDVDGEPVELAVTDEVAMSIQDATHENMELGSVELDADAGILVWTLDREHSLKFHKGKYRMSIVVLHAGEYRTILYDAPVLVR